MKTQAAMLFMVVAIFCTPVHAVTGNKLLEWLERDESSMEGHLATGYIVGVVETLQNLDVSCIPNEVTNGQIIDITERYLRAHPKLRHLLAPGLMRLAIREAYPCDK